MNVTLTNLPELPDGFEYTGLVGGLPAGKDSEGLWLLQGYAEYLVLTWSPYKEAGGLLVRKVPKWRALVLEDLKDCGDKVCSFSNDSLGNTAMWHQGELIGMELAQGVPFWKVKFSEGDVRLMRHGMILTNTWNAMQLPGYVPSLAGFKLAYPQ